MAVVPDRNGVASVQSQMAWWLQNLKPQGGSGVSPSWEGRGFGLRGGSHFARPLVVSSHSPFLSSQLCGHGAPLPG